jgi:hypothetical protein
MRTGLNGRSAASGFLRGRPDLSSRPKEATLDEVRRIWWDHDEAELTPAFEEIARVARASAALGPGA